MDKNVRSVRAHQEQERKGGPPIVVDHGSSYELAGPILVLLAPLLQSAQCLLRLWPQSFVIPSDSDDRSFSEKAADLLDRSSVT
jgi:hypothetical protein